MEVTIPSAVKDIDSYGFYQTSGVVRVKPDFTMKHCEFTVNTYLMNVFSLSQLQHMRIPAAKKSLPLQHENGITQSSIGCYLFVGRGCSHVPGYIAGG